MGIRELSGKLHEFMIALDKAGFKSDDIQEIITAKNNKLAAAMRTAYLAERGQLKISERYTLISVSQFVVPDNYDHEHQLDLFSRKNKEEFYSYNKNITDDNFSKATNKLVPGKTHEKKIFQINKKVSSEDNLIFLKSQSAILVGAQGLSLTQQLKMDEFPAGKWLLSFDERTALWQDFVPIIGRSLIDDWDFNLHSFKNKWGTDYCLLCLC